MPDADTKPVDVVAKLQKMMEARRKYETAIVPGDRAWPADNRLVTSQ